MKITKNILDIPIEDIKRIPLVDLSTIPYDEEKDEYNFENKVQFCYWQKGHEPDIYLKAELCAGDAYVCEIGETIKKDKNGYARALEEIKEGLIDSTIREKFSLICEEYFGLIKHIIKELPHDYYEVDHIEAIKILEDSPKVEKRFKKELQFYKDMFNKREQ